MERFIFAISIVACCFSLVSCGSGKHVVYLQEKGTLLSDTSASFDARIMPKDLITISVSTPEPEAALPFNLIVPSTQTGSNYSNLTSQPTLQNYLVDNDGKISFPVLGPLKIGGLTTRQTSEMIIDKLQKYLTQPPIVTVRLVNYKISVIGEVNRPDIYTVPNEKINIFEALAMAGDLTIYGRRNGVHIIREDIHSHRQVVPLDLNDANIIYSPYFYLQQNDIVYVEPNNAKKQSANIGSSTTLLVSVTSILISLAGLIVNILR